MSVNPLKLYFIEFKTDLFQITIIPLPSPRPMSKYRKIAKDKGLNVRIFLAT